MVIEVVGSWWLCNQLQQYASWIGRKGQYLGMLINSDISWDFHIQNLCKQMHYLLSLLRRLRAIFPQNLLIQVYKSYIQPKLDYGLIIYGCTTQENLTLVQRLQNHAARLILGNFDYINFRGIVSEITRSIYHWRKEGLLPSHIDV